jgi:hypothetical protein
MEKKAIIEKLKVLKVERGTISKIERAVNMPLNCLANYVNEQKVMPDKWVKPLSDYLENYGVEKEDWELKLQSLFDSPEQKELRKQMCDEIFMGGCLITKQTEMGIEVLKSGSKEWFDVLYSKIPEWQSVRPFLEQGEIKPITIVGATKSSETVTVTLKAESYTPTLPTNNKEQDTDRITQIEELLKLSSKYLPKLKRDKLEKELSTLKYNQ